MHGKDNADSVDVSLPKTVPVTKSEYFTSEPVSLSDHTARK